MGETSQTSQPPLPTTHQTTLSPQEKPFSTDLDYLQNALEWIEVRCWRITAQNSLARLDGSDPDQAEPDYWPRKKNESEDLHELKARTKRLVIREKKLRTTIDKRLKAHHKTVGPTSLDTLCQAFQLDAFERNVLLMTAAVAFSRRFEEHFGNMNPNASRSAINVEAAFDFNELPFTERIHYRSRFSKTGALISNDLVTIDLGFRANSPEDVLTAQLHVTNQTFAFLVGQPDLMNEFIEFSSVEAPIASSSPLPCPPFNQNSSDRPNETSNNSSPKHAATASYYSPPTAQSAPQNQHPPHLPTHKPRNYPLL